MQRTLRFLAAPVAISAAIGVTPSASSPWTMDPGGLYVYAGGFATSSQHFFDADGDRRRFLNDGTSQVYGVNLQAAYGVTERWMLLAEVPFLWYEVQNDLIRDAGRSPGDLRLDLRWRLPDGPLTTAVQGGVKFPTATTRNSLEAQVGEGQHDLELLASAGRQFRATGIWSSVDLGYRWRRRNTDTGFRPGNELIYRLELGYEVNRRLTVSTRVGGFDGGSGNARSFGFQLPTTTARRTASWNPALSYRLDASWQLVLSADVPVAGQRSYAGQLLAVGVAWNRSALVRLEGNGSFSHPRSTSCCQIQ